MAENAGLKAAGSLPGDLRATPQLWPLLAVMLGLPLVFAGTTLSMARVWWSNETFTHGFLILPISLWLVWTNRDRLRALRPAPDLRALFLLVPLLAGWLLATAVDVAAVRQLALVAMIPVVTWLACGGALLRALLFPLLYLFFAVPLGQGLIPPMMELTADMTVELIQRSGVPVYRDGLSFALPSGNWSVVEECSGVRYLIASLALGTIYAYLTYYSAWRRAAFMLAALVVPIIANGLRAYGIVMIGHLSGMKYAVGADHLLYGWVFFGLVMFLLFWLGSFWREAPPPTAGGADSAGDATPGAPPPRRSLRAAALGLAGLLLFSAGSTALLRPPPADTTGELPSLPALPASAAWERQPGSATGWTPLLQDPAALLTASYTGPRGPVDLTVGWYPVQRPGAEAVSSLNRLTDPYEGDWKLVAQRTVRAGDEGPAVAEAELLRGSEKLLVWRFYRLGAQLAADPYRAKLREAWGALLGGRHDAAFITLATPWDAPREVLRARLAAFWADAGPALARQLDASATAP
ncbi:MAG: exosortase A [Pseudohaliea sp.]